jgi:hypothetical protein
MRDRATMPNGPSARSPLAQHWPWVRRSCCAIMLITAGVSAREHVPLTVPFHASIQTLLASSNLDEKRYLMVPVSKQVGPDELLVGLKRGDAHARDREAFFEVYSYLPMSGRLRPPHASIGEPLHNYYNGELVRHANGNITCFVDVQQGGNVDRVIRLGLRAADSRDGGRTFSSPHRVGLIAGVEYGYVFDSVVRDGRTYVLAMRFANLAGGQPIHDRWPHAGSVDVLASDDNGASWRLIRSITSALEGAPINESALLPWGDGWLLACRGYDEQQWLLRTDAEFRPVLKRNLTADFDCINRYVGRPRLYARDGRVYLLGRNWTRPLSAERSPMQLCWFRVNPTTLAVETCVVLDNAERQNVVDGYYATAHWIERNGAEFLGIISHKFADASSRRDVGATPGPDLMRFEFLWEEVK